MGESAPPQGSGLSVPVDLIVIHLVALSSALLLPRKQGLSIKSRVLLAAAPQSPGGRPPGTLELFFTGSAVKQNESHYSAFCDACTLAGLKVLGVSDYMKSHLQKCNICQRLSTHGSGFAPYRMLRHICCLVTLASSMSATFYVVNQCCGIPEVSCSEP